MARVMEINTPLGKDILLFQDMSATEELGRLFEYQIGALSLKNDIDPAKLLGKNVTVKLELAGGGHRHFDGYVTRFGAVGSHGRHTRYQMTVRPWLWLLTLTTDCRIFQDKTVPEIVKEIFGKYPNAVFENRLTASYRKWEYCVQYRESDFNFVSRLMEQEGIYYFFTHADNKHTLILADSASAHEPFPGYAGIPFIAQEPPRRLDEECIGTWQFARRIEPGKYVLDDYDFKKPSTELQTRTKIERDNAEANHEHYDYPGDYVTTGEGEHYVRVRMEELQAERELAEGTGNARGLAVGRLFKLSKQARADQNREYLIVGAHSRLDYNEYEAQEGGGADFTCSFTAMSSKEPYRPRRGTPKPFVQGPQTAIVVGPEGDEIYTDQYGRVKVQFHWDRYGKKDENSSCWVRVSHPWAGKHWGMVAIPRIGQEVVVAFLEGDPDQPLITGRVYNAEQMPPYDLPANKTASGIKGRSTKEGQATDYSEFRFEDLKGSEQVYLHAQRNLDTVVEVNESHVVGQDRNSRIERNDNRFVKSNDTQVVSANQKITIGGNQTVSVQGNRKVAVNGSENESVAGGYTLHVGGDAKTHVGGTRGISTGGDYKFSVGGGSKYTYQGNKSVLVAADRKTVITGNDVRTVAGKSSYMTADYALTSGGRYSLTVGGMRKSVVMGADITQVTGVQSNTIGGSQTTTVGGACTLAAGPSLSLTAAGQVSFTAGATINVSAGGSVTIASSGPVTITAPIITLAAANVTVAGVLTVPTLIATSVVSTSYSPGVGNLV